ncbi:MAG: tRNA (adenosine(37)-N6)-dimethylallyltransferase MiaA [bacterium]|nr:tRNA (adenosine(37)-N6)-dimethylallyltransferase MiaA [bacterium]
MKDFPVIFIVGPTAAGKTEVAVKLAEKIDAEIVSADSMQVYEGLDIGTAKPPPEDLKRVKHHLIDIKRPGEEYNAGIFAESALKCIKKILDKKKNVIIAGGTGLYVRSLLYGIGETCPKDETFRKTAESKEKEELFEELKRVDAAAARAIGTHNKRRIIRALEIYCVSGKRFSENTNWNTEKEPEIFGRKCLIFGLDIDRAELYRRIEERVDKMVGNGLVEEAEKVIKSAAFENSGAAQAIGYKEFIPYFEGGITLAEAFEALKKNTRNFAKRQLTWFRKEKGVNWIKVDGMTADEVVEKIIEEMRKISLGNTKKG